LEKSSLDKKEAGSARHQQVSQQHSALVKSPSRMPPSHHPSIINHQSFLPIQIPPIALSGLRKKMTNKLPDVVFPPPLRVQSAAFLSTGLHNCPAECSDFPWLLPVIWSLLFSNHSMDDVAMCFLVFADHWLFGADKRGDFSCAISQSHLNKVGPSPSPR
jgi:hypothetical protein